jgi:hypothetical protein
MQKRSCASRGTGQYVYDNIVTKPPDSLQGSRSPASQVSGQASRRLAASQWSPASGLRSADGSLAARLGCCFHHAAAQALQAPGSAASRLIRRVCLVCPPPSQLEWRYGPSAPQECSWNSQVSKRAKKHPQTHWCYGAQQMGFQRQPACM